jgi:hypothetical protein
LDPRGVQTLERGKSKKNKGIYEGGEREVCDIIDTMVVARNNE